MRIFRTANDVLLARWLADPPVALVDPRPVWLEGCWMVHGLDGAGEHHLFAAVGGGGFERISGPEELQQGRLL